MTMYKDEENNRMDARSTPDMPHIEQPGWSWSADRRARYEPTSRLSPYNPLWSNYIQSRLKQFALRQMGQ